MNGSTWMPSPGRELPSTMRSYPNVVLFDLDNTLVPFLGPLHTWARSWAHEAVGPAESEPVARALIEATLDGPEDPKRGVQRVAERFGVEALEDAQAEAARAYRGAIEPYPGVCGLLGELWRAEVTLGLVTDAPEDRARVRLEAAGLERLFETVVTRDDTPEGKHGPEPFRLALADLDATATEAVMIGDWPAFDARWPLRLGMGAVLAGWGADPEDPRSPEGPPPCPVAGQPSEVPTILVERARAPSAAPRRSQARGGSTGSCPARVAPVVRARVEGSSTV